MHARNIQSLRQALGGSLRTSKCFPSRAREGASLGERTRRTAIAGGPGSPASRSDLLRTPDGHRYVCASLLPDRRDLVTGGVVTTDVVLKSKGPAERRPSQLESEIVTSSPDLSMHQVPAAIRFVPALETSPSGKFARCATLS